MSKGNLVRRIELVDNEINGKVNIIPFLEEALVEGTADDVPASFSTVVWIGSEFSVTVSADMREISQKIMLVARR